MIALANRLSFDKEKRSGYRAIVIICYAMFFSQLQYDLWDYDGPTTMMQDIHYWFFAAAYFCAPIVTHLFLLNKSVSEESMTWTHAFYPLMAFIAVMIVQILTAKILIK